MAQNGLSDIFRASEKRVARKRNPWNRVLKRSSRNEDTVFLLSLFLQAALTKYHFPFFSWYLVEE